MVWYGMASNRVDGMRMRLPFVPSAVYSLQSTLTILAADWLISIRILRYCALVQLLLAWLYLPNTLTAGAKYARDMSHDSETVH